MLYNMLNFCTPYFPSAQLKAFSKASKSLGSHRISAWLASPSRAPEHTHPLLAMCRFPHRHFLEWAAVLIFFSLPLLDPKQSRFLFNPQVWVVKVHQNEIDVTGSSSAWELGETYTCSATLLSCSCDRELGFRTSRLLDKIKGTIVITLRWNVLFSSK